MKKTTLIAIVFLLCFVLVSGYIFAQQKKSEFPKLAVTQQNFSGTWTGTYSSNLVPPTDVTLIFQQFRSTVTGTYLTANGAQGVMYGISQEKAGLQGQTVLTADQITPTCTGSFNMPITVSGDNMTWQFVGTDCLGPENGSGKATRSN